jgi:hypothetical protein
MALFTSRLDVLLILKFHNTFPCMIDFDSIMLYIDPNHHTLHRCHSCRKRKESEMVSMETLVIKTENKFRSLITKQSYKKGEVICEIPTAKVIDTANRYTVQIGRDRHTEVGKLSALNHSCDPNVILDTENLSMVARRDIDVGEELSFFYPSTEWEMDAPFICLCGASNCIHVVAGARFLPLSTLENHYLNRHIREMMVELLNNTELHLTQLTKV